MGIIHIDNIIFLLKLKQRTSLITLSPIMGGAEELIREVKDQAGPRQKVQCTKKTVNVLNFLTTEP